MIFDLEQAILNTWQIVDDLKIVTSRMKEKPSPDIDAIDLLEALEKIYQMKFEHTFKMFEEHCRDYYSIKNDLETKE